MGDGLEGNLPSAHGDLGTEQSTKALWFKMTIFSEHVSHPTAPHGLYRNVIGQAVVKLGGLAFAL